MPAELNEIERLTVVIPKGENLFTGELAVIPEILPRLLLDGVDAKKYTYTIDGSLVTITMKNKGGYEGFAIIYN